MQEKIPYKVIDEDKGYKLIKINSKMHLFYMNSRSSQFMMERDFFDLRHLGPKPSTLPN